VVSTGAEQTEAASDPASLAGLRLAGLLKRAQNLLIEGYGPALAPFAVDGRELAVLTLLAAEGPASQQHLSRRLAVDRTTMVALVDAMGGKGLVQRRPDPRDRRKNMIELTDAGRDTCRRATPAVDEIEDAFLSPITMTDRENLKDLLRTLISAAERPPG
jgi:DNA-binding MarR family transcriptional regulator